jgi:hypothetical protein
MWFVRSGNRVTGPFTEEQLRSMRQRGEFSPIHQISNDRVRWESAAQLVQMLDGAPPSWRSTPTPSSLGESPSGPHAPVGSPWPSPSHPGGASPSPPAPGPASAEWYYVDASRQQVGPVPEQAVLDLLRAKRLSGNTLACKVGATSWNKISQHPELAPFAPAGPGRAIALAASGALALGVFAVLLVLLLPRVLAVITPKGPGGAGDVAPAGGVVDLADPSTATPARLIATLDDQKQLEDSVGFVVCGWTIKWKDGDVQEFQLSSGSCFAVAPDGYLLTNKHVIEDMAPRIRMHPDYRIADYCNFRKMLIAADVKSLQEQGKKVDEDKLKKVLALYNPGNYLSVDPKVWVFFGSKEEMYEAAIVHISAFDMSILKVRRKSLPYFRVADVAGLPRPRTKVYALGFPGAARVGVSDDEESQRNERRNKNFERIQDQFVSSDFLMTTTPGEVSRIVDDTQNGQRIQHVADIKHGNSGGPLVTTGAIVVGINTWGTKKAGDLSGVYYALATPPLLKEISRAIDKDRGGSVR